MPVEFLSDQAVAAYGGFVGSPSPTELARWCLLDDADLRLINRRRVDHLRLGFALQLVAVRALGLFLVDPLDVPTVVLDNVADQLGVTDASCVKRYTERRPTRFDHQGEIVQTYGYRPFAQAAGQMERWVADRAFTSGEGPKALFAGAVGWLRGRQVLLPGVSTLARLVARVRESATQRVYDILAGQVSAAQAGRLDRLLQAPEGARVSLLEQWRHGPRASAGRWSIPRSSATPAAVIPELRVRHDREEVAMLEGAEKVPSPTTVTVPRWRERCEIHFSVTCLRHAEVVNAWIPIAGLAVVAVLVWVLAALDR